MYFEYICIKKNLHAQLRVSKYLQVCTYAKYVICYMMHVIYYICACAGLCTHIQVFLEVFEYGCACFI